MAAKMSPPKNTSKLFPQYYFSLHTSQHQQILGSGSPLNGSTSLELPETVASTTRPRCLLLTFRATESSTRVTIANDGSKNNQPLHRNDDRFIHAHCLNYIVSSKGLSAIF